MTTTKIKGLCKGSFKYISHLFVVKERELEIGSPTDVKHVAHIGWDGPNGTSPSWMNELKGGSDLALASIGSIGGSLDPTWSSQDFEHKLGRQPSSAKLSNFPPANTPTSSSSSSKQNRKKSRLGRQQSSSSSPKTCSTSARSSRSSKHKSMLGDSEEANTRRTLKL